MRFTSESATEVLSLVMAEAVVLPHLAHALAMAAGVLQLAAMSDIMSKIKAVCFICGCLLFYR